MVSAQPVSLEFTAPEPAGRRRWARGSRRNDFTYYTFKEYLIFVEAIGFSRDSHGHEGFEDWGVVVVVVVVVLVVMEIMKFDDF